MRRPLSRPNEAVRLPVCSASPLALAMFVVLGADVELSESSLLDAEAAVDVEAERDVAGAPAEFSRFGMKRS